MLIKTLLHSISLNTQQLAAQEKAKYRMATETVKVIPAITCIKLLALTAVTLAIAIGPWGWEKIIIFTQYPTVIWIHCFSNNKMKTFNMLQSNLLFLFVALFTLLSQCISREFEHMCCIEDYVNIPISGIRILLKWMHVFNAKWLIKLDEKLVDGPSHTTDVTRTLTLMQPTKSFCNQIVFNVCC